jgi:hypothetical protein
MGTEKGHLLWHMQAEGAWEQRDYKVSEVKTKQQKVDKESSMIFMYFWVLLGRLYQE